MSLTKNAIIYGLIGLTSSLGFFYLLDYAIIQKRWTMIWVIATLYGMIWCTSGWFLSKGDSARSYRGNLGLVYHMTATLVTLAAAIVATTLYQSLSLSDLLWVSFAMLASLTLHWLTTRHQPKGIDSKEAFK